MPTLSSCYFCGTALDAPIESYPVVPEGLPTESQQTVALCPTCHRKHHALLEYVLDAIDEVEADEATVEEYDDLDAAAGEDETGGGSNQSAAASVDADDGGTTTVDAAPADPAVESETAETSDDGTEAEESAGEEDPEPDVADETTPDATDTVSEEAGGTLEADDEDGDAASTDSEEAADDDGGGRPAILSTPAAKKAIRLLQNRDFPVERAEFQDLASSAYNIPPQDCEDVLDALVSEGYIDEKKGQLVREE
jgi:hypothetical protein